MVSRGTGGAFTVVPQCTGKLGLGVAGMGLDATETVPAWVNPVAGGFGNLDFVEWGGGFMSTSVDHSGGVRLAIASPNKFKYSETFIHAHVRGLPFEKVLLHGGYLPRAVSDGLEGEDESLAYMPWWKRLPILLHHYDPLKYS